MPIETKFIWFFWIKLIILICGELNLYPTWTGHFLWSRWGWKIKIQLLNCFRPMVIVSAYKFFFFKQVETWCEMSVNLGWSPSLQISCKEWREKNPSNISGFLPSLSITKRFWPLALWPKFPSFVQKVILIILQQMKCEAKYIYQ